LERNVNPDLSGNQKESATKAPRHKGYNCDFFFEPLYLCGNGKSFATKLQNYNYDGLVKSQKMSFSVIPAKAGIQFFQGVLDSRLRGSDGFWDFLRNRQLWYRYD